MTPNAVIELANNPHVVNDEVYRYWLHRQVNNGGGWRGLLTVVMLNPSTADAHQDDPTIRRVTGFAEREGFADFIVVNLFARRATHPELLQQFLDRDGLNATIGPENDVAMGIALEHANDVLLAWGADPRAFRALPFLLGRLRSRGSFLPIMHCLGRTQSGAPRHPLFVPKNEPLQGIDVHDVEKLFMQSPNPPRRRR